MAKLVIQHEQDPAIGIVLVEVPPDVLGVAQGWRGTCTECGRKIHRWRQERAIEAAQKHVDSHESAL